MESLDSVYSWITSYLLFEDTEALNHLKARLCRNRLIGRRLAFDTIIDVIDNCPLIYPDGGCVRCEGDPNSNNSYCYLHIDDNDRYINRISTLLNVIEQAYGMSNIIEHNESHVDLSRYAVFRPPAHIGTHITLSKDIPAELIGKHYTFDILKSPGIVTHPNGNWGIKPDPAEPDLHIYSWYVIYVAGLPEQLTKDIIGHTHIAVGTLGWKTLEQK